MHSGSFTIYKESWYSSCFYEAESVLNRVRLWVHGALPCNGVGNKCQGRYAFFLTTLGSQQSLAVHTQSWVVRETVKSQAFQTFLLCHRCIVPVQPLETSSLFVAASSFFSRADWKVCAHGNLLGGGSPEILRLTHLLKCLYVLLHFKSSALGLPLDMSFTSIFLKFGLKVLWGRRQGESKKGEETTAGEGTREREGGGREKE